MNLYSIDAICHHDVCGYDVTRAFVVAADDPDAARRFTAGACGDECGCYPGSSEPRQCFWQDPAKSVVTRIGLAHPDLWEKWPGLAAGGVVMRDYRAG